MNRQLLTCDGILEPPCAVLSGTGTSMRVAGEEKLAFSSEMLAASIVVQRKRSRSHSFCIP